MIVSAATTSDDDNVDQRHAAFAAMGCEAMAPRCADAGSQAH
jgi:hypothetical protein